MMRIAVLGAGGVGGYFGGRLAAAGSDITFVARGRHLAALREHGLRIESELGDLHLPAPKTVETLAEVGDVDLVIVAVKLWDTEDVARQLAPLATRGAAILSLQNGVQKDDIYRQHLPADAVLGGVCYISAVIAAPGVIRHSGRMQRIVFGEYDGQRSPRVQAFAAACAAAGIDHLDSEAIERMVWEKFVFLVGLSGTTTSMRSTMGPILGHPATRAFLYDLMDEAVQVGIARGVPLPRDFAEDRMAFLDKVPAGMNSSMHHDLASGNPLEIEWLSGDVARMGAGLGIPTPCNRAVASILALQAPGTRDRG